MDVIKKTPVKGAEYHKETLEWCERMLEWRKDYRYGDQMWDQADRLIIGNHWSSPDTDEPSADNPRSLQTVNKVQSALNDYLPFLVRTDPSFLVTPTREDAVENAAVGTAGLNYYWAEQAMQREYRASVWDGLAYGVGICKTGYILDADFPTAEGTREGDSAAIEYDMQVRVDHPIIRRVAPRMFVWDILSPTSDLRGARRVSELFVRPLADVLEDKRYSKKVRAKLRTSETQAMTYLDWLGQRQAGRDSALHNQHGVYEQELDHQASVVLSETWDKKTNQYILHALGVPEPLVEEDWKFPYLDNFPYVMWKYMDISDQPGSPGIPIIMRDMQHEYDRIRTAEYEHRRRFGTSKYIVADSAFSKEQEQKLLSNEDSVLKAQHVEQVHMLPVPKWPESNRETLAGIDEDMNDQLGRDALMAGGNLPSRTSAREIDARQSNSSLKAQDRIVRVDEFSAELGSQVWKHMQANLTKEVVLKITDHIGASRWVNMDNATIQGDFGIETTSSSKPPLNSEEDKAQRLSLLQTCIQASETMQQSGKTFEWDKLMAFVLEGYDTPPGESFIIDAQTGQDFDKNISGEQASAEQQGTTIDAPTPGPINPASLAQGPAGAAQGGLNTGANS